jgi:hypothetical protein
MSPDRKPIDETFLWLLLAALFPLLYWTPGYDSFHEPKWLFLTGWTGLLLLIRSWNRVRLLSPWTPLEPPALACLAVTFLAWRWQAADRWVSFAFWARLPVMYLVFRLALGWILGCDEPTRARRVRQLLNASLFGGVVVGVWAIAQDWGWLRWSSGPVSDWRFHLDATLGNPNEVGGYLVYLLPITLARWLGGNHRSRGSSLIWGGIALVQLYALTTVFTVGAWLGLFVVLPLATLALPVPSGPRRRRTVACAIGLSAALFGLLRLVLLDTLDDRSRLLLFFAAGALILGVSAAVFAWIGGGMRWRAIAAVSGLLLVWGILLPSWGLPNHPSGLISEALDSPRWKGGFGARRFIWETTALMVKDHPVRGIGWGHYFNLHNLYQGELYRQRGLPHDRPSVGIVPQVHSDPLQVVAEAGVMGGVAFLWLVLAAGKMGWRIIRSRNGEGGEGMFDLWACWAGLWLVFFHCLADFPLRQPQPVLLSIFYLAILAATSCPELKEARLPLIVGGNPGLKKWAGTVFGLLFISASCLGFQGQSLLKRGFEGMMTGMRATNPALGEARLHEAARMLDTIRYPLPETHDRWLYRARIALALGDMRIARATLEQAGNYRHGLALYEAWAEYGRAIRDPKISLEAARGLLLYNPCWAEYHDEAARLLRIMGKREEADKEAKEADRLRVPEKPMP